MYPRKNISFDPFRLKNPSNEVANFSELKIVMRWLPTTESNEIFVSLNSFICIFLMSKRVSSPEEFVFDFRCEHVVKHHWSFFRFRMEKSIFFYRVNTCPGSLLLHSQYYWHKLIARTWVNRSHLTRAQKLAVTSATHTKENVYVHLKHSSWQFSRRQAKHLFYHWYDFN